MNPKPLRILMLVHLPWDARLGAVRVWMELAEQWRAMGHTVEKLALSDAFPDVRAEGFRFALRQLAFTRRAAEFVRKKGGHFDVIDALIGSLPFSKEELGFRGLIVARSVGLYRLYERFEASVPQRWPQPTGGKLIGHLFHRWTRCRLRAASERSVRMADLVNVPNDDEARCLRDELGLRRVIVEPYGLSDERRAALEAAAQTAEARLAQKRICFIGMWSPRKGSYDWPGIIAAVRRQEPEARFRFLGTMLEAVNVRADLGNAATGDIEVISDYAPEDLPRLLADCTVGAFPSYVEGFGLAVIEQLAAGLPTVAYDTAGPRDILRTDLPDLLVSSGDVSALSDKLVHILQLDTARYAALSETSRRTARRFSWREIAQATIRRYAELREKSSSPVIFLQPFSLGWAGGGAKILRALTEHAPLGWLSISSSAATPKSWRDEVHLRSRPSWGRFEHSRLAALPKATARLFAGGFARRLKKICRKLNACAIHTVPHAGMDFAVAHRVARELSLPFFISVHDDLAYTSGDRSARREAAMRTAWQEATARFVISDALGQEYVRRYGAMPYLIVTDGLTNIAAAPRVSASNRLRIYFMGLFHMAYEPNLRAFLDAIRLFGDQQHDMHISVILRCEHVRPHVLAGTKEVSVLPFAGEKQVAHDLEQADLLYMPMPFGAEHEQFARYSLSTKMVTYVGSGVPIFYHGPVTSAAFALLNSHRAALCVPTLDTAAIVQSLRQLTIEKRTEQAANALALARREFMLADQQDKFWGEILGCLKRA